MSNFMNPLAHVVEPDVPTVILGGRNVSYKQLGLKALGKITQRFPGLQAALTGEDVDLSQFDEDDNEAMQELILTLALAPGVKDDEDLASIRASIRALKPMERDLAVNVIMAESFPDTVVEQEDAGNAPKKQTTRRAAGATAARTKKKPAAKPKPRTPGR